jgi:hypothetical protein
MFEQKFHKKYYIIIFNYILNNYDINIRIHT